MCRVWKLSFSKKQLYSFTLCFFKKGRNYMFDFVEQPVVIRDYEYALVDRHPTPVVMQNGVQPVALFQEDVRSMCRPQSLLGSVFSFRKRKG